MSAPEFVQVWPCIMRAERPSKRTGPCRRCKLHRWASADAEFYDRCFSDRERKAMAAADLERWARVGTHGKS